MEKIVLFFALILFAKPAYAYIDPSIGAMFIQGLIAALLLIPFYAKRIIGYIKKIFYKNDSFDKKKDTIDD